MSLLHFRGLQLSLDILETRAAPARLLGRHALFDGRLTADLLSRLLLRRTAPLELLKGARIDLAGFETGVVRIGLFHTSGPALKQPVAQLLCLAWAVHGPQIRRLEGTAVAEEQEWLDPAVGPVAKNVGIAQRQWLRVIHRGWRRRREVLEAPELVPVLARLGFKLAVSRPLRLIGAVGHRLLLDIGI